MTDDVYIVSKTHMNNAVCIGGILLSGRMVRLLDRFGHNQPLDTAIKIGDYYSISYIENPDIEFPHSEDILVSDMTYKRSTNEKNLRDFITRKINKQIWRGRTHLLFDGCLNWTPSGSGYVSPDGDIPKKSTGFWIPSWDLTRKDFNGKIRYEFMDNPNLPGHWISQHQTKYRYFPFVGFQEPVDIIPKGTLLRVSLARWWSPDNITELRCYLQLSGWYNLPKPK